METKDSTARWWFEKRERITVMVSKQPPVPRPVAFGEAEEPISN
jgi:hypothetical protein